MEQAETRFPYANTRARHEGFVALGQRLVGLTEEGRLPETLAARHLGRFLMEHGRIRMTRFAKRMEEDKIMGAKACEGCVHFPDCLTEHHEAWPRNEYVDDPVGVAYRELPQNKELLCQREHVRLHRQLEPPVKPTRQEMAQQVCEAIRDLDPKLETEILNMVYSQPDAAA